MSQFVLDSGQRLVDFVALEKFFKKQGIETSLPTGFTGKVDALGKAYDQAGKVVGNLPTKVMFPTVLMNDTGKGDWVFQAVRPDGTGANYFYRVETLREKRASKFGVVDDLVGKIDNIRSRWLQGIKGFHEEIPQTVAAVILELLYTFSARIGSTGNSAGGESTYGLGTILCTHLKLTATGFVMQYKGKDGVLTKHVYKGEDPVSKLVVKAVTELAEGKGPKDLLFTFNQNGVRKRLPSNIVNKVFRALGAGDATVHKFRTLRGTTIFREEMEKLFAKKATMDNSSQAMTYFKEIALKVGKALNHVRRGTDGSSSVSFNTALASYIDTNAQLEFFRHYELPLPAFLSKKTSVLSSENTEGEHEDLDTSLINEYLAGEKEVLT
jgi:hypothetical protein